MSWPPSFQKESNRVSSGAEIVTHYRTSGSKRPLLLLLHGYPQNSSMWKDFASSIAPDWSLFIPDLPGYGESVKAIGNTTTSRPFSKRSMAHDILEAIDQITGAKDAPVIAVGHDRGARVAYCMALDHPSRVMGCAVLDIVPTIHVWQAMNAHNNHFETHRSHHWVSSFR
jgi:haloacetate dehalogenase